MLSKHLNFQDDDDDGSSGIAFATTPVSVQLGKLWGAELILDRSKISSEWAEFCPYMGIRAKNISSLAR